MKPIRIRMPVWAVHHALKAGGLAGAAAVAVHNYNDIHWALLTADVALFVLMFLGCGLGVLHIRATGTPDDKGSVCHLCRTVPATRLRRPHWRLVMAYGRWGLLVPLAEFAALLLVGPLVWSSDDDSKATSFNLVGTTMWAVLVLSLLSYLAARRFYRRHDPGADDVERLHRWMKRHAEGAMHRSYRLTLGSMICFLVAVQGPDDGPWGVAKSAMLVVTLLCFLLEHHHQRSMCERCGQDLRIDAPEIAAERMWRFTAHHRISERGMPFFILPLFAAVFIPDPWDGLAMIPIYGACVVAMVFGEFHNRYQPWCPICYPRDGGGGGGRPVVPDPAGGHGRPLPV